MKRILIIENQATTHHEVKNILGQRDPRDGYEVLEAGTDSQALEILKSKPVDMVVMDLTNSWNEGFHLCEAIKKLDHHLPLIMLSPQANSDLEIQMNLVCAPDCFLTKPIENSILLHTIKEVLAKERFIGLQV